MRESSLKGFCSVNCTCSVPLVETVRFDSSCSAMPWLFGSWYLHSQRDLTEPLDEAQKSTLCASVSFPGNIIWSEQDKISRRTCALYDPRLSQERVCILAIIRVFFVRCMSLCSLTKSGLTNSHSSVMCTMCEGLLIRHEEFLSDIEWRWTLTCLTPVWVCVCMCACAFAGGVYNFM